MLRVVRLGGHQVRKARANVADALDVADVFLYRDSSVAPLLEMRRSFNAVVDALGAMIRSGISLSRSVIGFSLWGRCILLLWMIFLFIGVWTLVLSFMPLLMFIAVLVISSVRLWFIVVMRRFGVAELDFFPPAPFLQCTPHLTLGGSGILSDPARIDDEF